MDLLANSYGSGNHFVANTSQSLNQMPHASDDKPLMCLTCGPEMMIANLLVVNMLHDVSPIDVFIFHM